MCVEVYSNGEHSGKDTHVSVYVRLMAGNNDDQLQWPFVGDIDIMLLNWREDKGHHKMTISINASSSFVRVLDGTIGNKYWGFNQLISHSSLCYNRFTKTTYLHNDSLCLLVKQVAVYSIPLLLKAPSWQDPLHNFSRFVSEFTLNEFSKRKHLNNKFCSPSFYTCRRGYKMCIKVLANGSCSGKGTHVSVYVTIMAGDYDDQLQWPFVGDIKLMLLNWREDKRHLEKTLSINATSGLVKVLEGKFGQSWGYDQLVSHLSLRCNRFTRSTGTNTEYLHNDSLCLQVKQVVVYSTLQLKIPSWQDPRRVSQSVCEFTLNEFTKRKQWNNKFHSPCFFTHQQGYKMCLEVYSNGEHSSSKGTHVSVYVRLMAGDNDHQLQWPFVGDIDIMLLNWREDDRHYKKTISIIASNGLVRVLKGENGKCWGHSQFISHLSLSNNSSAAYYLQNDSLRFRVNQVAVYSTPLLLKTPSWQNPSNVSQSLCEFTLNEFSKRKQFNNRFYSSSFFTQHGYKMCVNVHANGSVNGKNTHVSVFVQLVTGENDDQLQWPFVGDVDIMLLNWREDKGHYKKTIPVTASSGLVRVLAGESGKCWGYFMFILHSSLPYNSSTNTDYLQNDCLRFRVNINQLVNSCVVM